MRESAMEHNNNQNTKRKVCIIHVNPLLHPLFTVQCVLMCVANHSSDSESEESVVESPASDSV